MDNIREFPVLIYGQLEKYNEVLSKARVRIFYKGGNRNGTFISDDFAEKLIASIPYAPIKGIYEDGDYTDHGTERTEGRIYGIVPEQPNLEWENHIDEDGVTRTYACVDVLIFTALYEEANEIVGKPQSMEIYGPSVKYHYEIINGIRYAVLDEGCFLGLQVLGDETEPCFEGASFYALQDNIENVIQKLQALSETYTNKGGKLEMPNITFKLSDSQKYDALMSLLNPGFEETYEISCLVVDVFDDYAIANNFETGKMERIYYAKDDETDSLSITERKTVFIMDVTEEEKTTLDTLRKLNGDTYELVSENLTNADENAEKVNTMETKVEELEGEISTLNTEKDEMIGALEEAKTSLEESATTLNSLTEELETLKEYKLSIETNEKNQVIEEYSNLLSDEVLDEYRAKIGEYTVEELDMHLAYALKKTNATVFQTGSNGYTPIEEPKTGIDAILAKYKN